MSYLDQAFGCQIGEIFFAYLGLPLGTTRPSVADFMPILNIMERHLMGLTRMLTYAGRLILVNSIYAAMPIFACALSNYPLKSLTKLTNIESISSEMVGISTKRVVV